MSARSKLIVQLCRDKLKNEENLNRDSMQCAIEDVFEEVPEVNTQIPSSAKSSESKVQIKQFSDSFTTATRTTPFEIYYEDNKPPENNAQRSSLDVDYDNNKRTYQLVNYDFETDEDCDFSTNSDNDPAYQPMSQRDENDITDFSDYDILNETKVETKTRRRKSNAKTWKVNQTKSDRANCQPYKNQKKECNAKVSKPIDCGHCKFKCTTYFTEDERSAICKTYWAFADYSRQKDFILKYIQTEQPKRRKISATSEKARHVSKAYFLENSSGKHRVCAKFFERTLCISNGPINTAIKGASTVGCFSAIDMRGKKVPGNKTNDAAIAMVKNHIESFPAMESHYVRASSKKLYLDSGLSIFKMHELYKTLCEEKNLQPVSEKTYRRIFCNNYNYSFFKPKKDLCALCAKYDQATTVQKEELETEYTFHLIRKNQCNEAKENDKLRCKDDPSFITCSFDLQSVLQLPFSGVSLFYYSRKICVYNLTIYVGYGEIAHCYTWNELNGKRGSSEVGSILFNFLKSLPTTVTEVSLFCDTCGGQNRNQQVAAILLHAVKNIAHIKKIELKFLESGHSHMECDSMHSAIESAKKYKTAFMMADWVNIFKSARSCNRRSKIIKSNGEYQVHLLKFTDFYNLQELASNTIKNRNKDENGNKVSWLKMKCIKFEKEYPEILFYRYDHTSDYKKIYVVGRGRPRATSIELKPAYSQIIPITAVKKADLIKLVNAGHIPEELTPWYKSLPSIDSKNPDRLPEPSFDETDEDE